MASMITTTAPNAAQAQSGTVTEILRDGMEIGAVGTDHSTVPTVASSIHGNFSPIMRP
jgi:hypothetical protein